MNDLSIAGEALLRREIYLYEIDIETRRDETLKDLVKRDLCHLVPV